MLRNALGSGVSSQLLISGSYTRRLTSAIAIAGVLTVSSGVTNAGYAAPGGDPRNAPGSPPAPAADCSRTSVGLVPVSDLGNGAWLGHEGGLYPGGANEPPPEHAALAGAAAAHIAPLDASGNPDADGALVLLSVGMSNATQEFQEFIAAAAGDATLNPRLRIVDGAQGGQTASVIRDPAARFWTVIDQRLRTAGLTAAQVQAVWLKEANARPSGDAGTHALELATDLAAIARLVKDRLPNTALLYNSSRTYAGYASTALNPEPYAYASGFAVKWLVQSQIDHEPSLNADPARGPVEAPVLLWGPYLWADGTTPRSDGLTWTCAEFGDDGTHPSAAGRRKVGEMLLRFLKDDPAAAPWFLASSAVPSPVPTQATTTPSPGTTPPAPTATAPTPAPSVTPLATPGAKWTLWLPTGFAGTR